MSNYLPDGATDEQYSTAPEYMEEPLEEDYSVREPTEEEIAQFVASRTPPLDATEFLRPIVKEAKRHWDDLGKPYPEHLQSAIDFLSEAEQPCT